MPGRPNIVFVMLDTLRADALRLYGGDIAMPVLEGVAKRCAVYQNAISPSTYTVPSHTSLFLGRRPLAIGALVREHGQRAGSELPIREYVGKGEVTLAQKLGYIGYRTALFSNNPWLTPQTGIANGFEHIDSLWQGSRENAVSRVLPGMRDSSVFMGIAKAGEKMLPRGRIADKAYLAWRKKMQPRFSTREYGERKLDAGAARTNADIDDYLAKGTDSDNFIFINYMEAHDGYPTELVTDKRIEQDKWLYLSGFADTSDVEFLRRAFVKRVEYLDSELGKLLGTLKKRGVLDNARVVFTSDHGQAFMEHDQLYHDVFPYQEIVRVPLVMARYESGKQVSAKASIETPYAQTDLHGMLLDIGYGKEPSQAKKDGVVLSDHIGTVEGPEMQMLRRLRHKSGAANAIYEAQQRFNRNATAIYAGDYKLIHHYGAAEDELYMLSKDSAEEHNIIDKEKGIALKLLKAGKAQKV